MSTELELVCCVCTEDFLVTLEAYTDRRNVVCCPCCGSTELLRLVYDADDPVRQRGLVA